MILSFLAVLKLDMRCLGAEFVVSTAEDVHDCTRPSLQAH